MRLTLTVFLLLRNLIGPADASRNPKLQPRVTPASRSAAPVVVTATEGGSTWTQTYSPTKLKEYASVTGPTTITSTDKAGQAILIGVFAGGLAWVAAAAAGPKPVPPPPTPPPEVPDPPETPDPKTTTSDKPAPTSSSATWTNTKKPQTVIIHKPKFEHSVKLDHQNPIKAPHESTNCAEMDGPKVERKVALDKIKGFCKKFKSSIINGEGVKDSPYVGRGIVFDMSAKLSEICPAKFATMMQDGDCEWLLRACLDNCDTHSDQKHGGTVFDGCLVMTAVAQEYEGDLECQKEIGKDGDLGVRREDVIGSIKKFCADNGGKSVKPGTEFRKEYLYERGNSAAEISVSYDSKCKTEDVPEYDVDQAACERFLSKAVDGCDTKSQIAKFGGTVADHCGLFSLKTRNVERISCGLQGEDIRTDAKTVTRDFALEAIKDYCGKKLTHNPNLAPSPKFHQFPEKGSAKTRFLKNDIVVLMNVRSLDQFETEIQRSGWPREGCEESKEFALSQEECERKLKTIIDDCDVNTTTEKKGGYLVDKTSRGCAVWSFSPHSAR